MRGSFTATDITGRQGSLHTVPRRRAMYSRPTRIQLAISLATLIAWGFLASHAGAQNINGRVTGVTLFRGQAQVTRAIPIEGEAGVREIVVAELPEQIVPDSLFAEGGDAVEIRAVRFQTRAVGEEPREEVRQLDGQMLEVQRNLELNAKRQNMLVKRNEYLSQLESFVAPTAQSDLSQGVLNAETLERISAFSFEQHESIAEQEVELSRQAYELNQQLHLLQRQRAEITAGASQTIREARIFIQKNAPGAADIQLNYLVNDCGWSPAYTMRSTADRRQVRVEYNALIQQLTGEDWSDVRLTLSTASPAISAAGPGLAPFHVALTSGAVAINSPAQIGDQAASPQVDNFYGQGLTKMQVVDQLQGLNSLRNSSNEELFNSYRFEEQNRANWTLNDVAYAFQQLEINGDATTVSVLRAEANDKEGPSLSYQLPGVVSLDSRTDQQMVRIMQTDMESKFYHVAVPVLTSYVYREAELMNASDEDLLAGPITVYLDGRFVGRGEIPTVARGQSYIVGFGADPQLRARRELADKTDNVQGGNRETRFEYRLVVENFSNELTAVRVIDRLPNPQNGADIRVALGEASDPISTDKLYVRRERPMGILRWDIDAPANAAAEDARIIDYKYAVEYDRQYVVSLPSSKQSLQEEFERLQIERRKQ
jgi:hypothetical protein